VAPDAPGRGEPFALLAVGAAGEDQVFGDHLVFQNFLVIVDILDEGIEGEDPLLQAALDLLPVIAGNDAGDDVEWKIFSVPSSRP
jgi:hypothetical protein